MKRKLRRLRHTHPEWVTALNFKRIYPSIQINKVTSEISRGIRFVYINLSNFKYSWYWAIDNAEIRTIGIKPNK